VLEEEMEIMILRNRLTRGALALAAVAAAAFGADTSGKILGTVKDPAGNLIPRVAASLTNRATGVKQNTRADERFTRSPSSRNRRH